MQIAGSGISCHELRSKTLLTRIQTMTRAVFGSRATSPARNIATEIFMTPKAERLVQRIVRISTKPGDWVLDSFAGSGTTGAVAHKMGRRWIMVELGGHCHTHIIPRLKKVIDGTDPGGITEAAGWKG